MKQYTPLKAGTGHKIHAGVVVGEVTEKNRKYGQRVGKVYSSLCTLTNTHVISRQVRLALLPEGTEITCENCLRRMHEKEQEQEQGLQKFSEKLYADLFGNA